MEQNGNYMEVDALMTDPEFQREDIATANMLFILHLFYE